jgi:phasin family protein
MVLQEGICHSLAGGQQKINAAVREEMSMTQTQPSFLDMFKDLAKGLKLPRVDADSLLETHRKNIAALEQSARIASEGATSLAAKQAEIVKTALHDVAEMAQGLRADPRNALANQTEFAKKTFEAAVKNTKDIAELIQKSNTDVLKVIQERMKESLESIRGSSDKGK